MLRERLARRIPPLFRGAHIRQLNSNLRGRLLGKPFEQGLLLWGAAGVGKTHTAMAMIRWYVTRRISVQRVTFAELLLSLRSSFNGSGTERDVIRPLLDAPVLVLDDVAAGSLSDYSTTALLNILDCRIEHCKPTIITTNLSPENLGEAFGQRIASRVETFLSVKLAGRDKREKHSAARCC